MRVAVLLAATLVPPAAASDIRVDLDDRAAGLITLAFEREGVNARLLDEILASRGYELMFRHAAVREGRARDEVEADFRAALGAALDGAEEPGFGLERVRARPASYRRTLKEIRSVGGGVSWRVVERVNGFLPPRSGFASTAHLVVGGKEAGRAFGDRDDVTLRIDDFVPAEEGAAFDVDRFASVLAHELFHVGFRAAGGLPPRPEREDTVYGELVEAYGRETVGEVWRASEERSWDGAAMAARFDAWVPPPTWNVHAMNELVAVLSLIQNEGCAAYVAAPLRDPGTTRRHAGEVAAWMGSVDDDFARLAEIVRRFGRAADADEVARLATEALADDGPLYRVGYRIAERIDSFSGRRPLLSTMSGGPLDFFETYFETHPYGPGQMDPGTEEEIAAVIREIRGMGAFDPEE